MRGHSGESEQQLLYCVRSSTVCAYYLRYLQEMCITNIFTKSYTLQVNTTLDHTL